MEKNTSDTELETGKAHTILEVIEYVPIAVLIKTINKKSIGNISIMSFDSGEGLTEKTSPFDTFAQIVKEMLRLLLQILNYLESCTGIIIPAHLPNYIKLNSRFKIIQTKSGYE